MRYRVRARNTATASANKIHDDSVARSLGFRGGLVPGVDVYAYLCHIPLETWGRAWLERGRMRARFTSPTYDGDDVEVSSELDPDGALDLTLRDSSGAICATAHAALLDEVQQPPAAADWPVGPTPSSPPPATAEVLNTVVFGAVKVAYSWERSVSYLDDISEQLGLFRLEHLAHPAWILRQANHVLALNVALGPWIHVESSVEHFGVLSDGEEIETRALVVGTSERSGHELVDLDVLHLASGRVVARTAHTAIYRPRGT